MRGALVREVRCTSFFHAPKNGKNCSAVEINLHHSAPIVAPQSKFIYTAVQFLRTIKIIFCNFADRT